MTLQELQALKASGQFHHATQRDLGRMFEALHIYAVDSNGFHGFRHVGAFFDHCETLTPRAEYEAAYELVRGTGVSVGAYGCG